jgi:beta-galactosidase
MRKSILIVVFLLITCAAFAQGVKFNRDLSPAEGLIKPQEKPHRNEICLNGRWEFQPIAVPGNWISGKGTAPELTNPDPDKWEGTKIKIPSPWNVNDWGGGINVGQGSNSPYAPGSVYYPSYPAGWVNVKMGWLRRYFVVPADWKGKRAVLHFEAVAGDCEVLINGKICGHNMDAYLPFDIDITNDIKQGGQNELLVGVRSRKLFDKKDALYSKMSAIYPPGSNTSDLIGIWQDVFLQALPPVRVDSIFAKPAVDKNELDFEVKLVNQTRQSKQVHLSGTIKEWVNHAGKDILSAPEINWSLGKTALQLKGVTILLNPGESKTIIIKTKVDDRLKLWSPEQPNLYTVSLNSQLNGKEVDCKTERFGWRQFTIKGKYFYLNGKKIQGFGDLQHPFGPYIMSRRFAWAWFKMIKDFGGNAVRPHAQPWPRIYYDLADEMGLMVLDEDALFGSSIALNLQEDITWKRTAEEVGRLILRDRNHPSVFGWSVGNEIFAIALLNKPSAAVAEVWDNKLIQLAQLPLKLDPTRVVVTSDGDKDLRGNLPVWSKHLGHGLHLDLIPDINKPIVIGEFGATYYGKPGELFPFVGLKAYGSYYQRNEALAIDLYQNVVQMARPLLAYFSPSEICWFGIEHLNLGYHDFLRLPGMQDGIFPAKPYQEGKPGYQEERIPPYVTTFNPGLDPQLPLYKPLPLFEALKAALSKNKPAHSKWDHYQDTAWQRPVYPVALYHQAVFVGNRAGKLATMLTQTGLNINPADDNVSLIVIDGDNVTANELDRHKALINKVRKNGGLIWLFVSNGQPATPVMNLLPPDLKFMPFKTTALQGDSTNAAGKLLNLRDTYFSEMNGDKYIVKQVITGNILNHSSIVLKPAKTDWYLFSGAPENRKCAQIVLYEHLQQPPRAALINIPFDRSHLYISAIDYNIVNQETISFWKKLFAATGINTGQAEATHAKDGKKHDLLMDGPVN